MPLGRKCFYLLCSSFAIPLEAASLVFCYWRVFSLLEKILPIALFSRVWVNL